MQLTHAIPLIQKQKTDDTEKNVETSCIVQDLLVVYRSVVHHLIKNTIVIILDKLTAREIYSALLLSSGNIPTSQKYFEKFFQMKISILKEFQRNFQYKILYNILYLNKMLFTFDKTKHLCVHSVIHAMRLLDIYFQNAHV